MTTPPEIPAPAGARLRLREFVAADRAALVEMHADARVREWLVDDAPLDDARVAAEFIVRMQRYYRAHEGLGIWCAEHWASVLSAAERDDPAVREALSDAALAALATPRPRFAGWFNLMRTTDDPGEVEIGCRLRPSAWGHGLVYDGGEALLAHAFATLGLPRVWGLCHPGHRSVHRVLQVLGFRDAGPWPAAGPPVRAFVIDAAEWPRVAAIPRRRRLRAAFGR